MSSVLIRHLHFTEIYKAYMIYKENSKEYGGTLVSKLLAPNILNWKRVLVAVNDKEILGYLTIEFNYKQNLKEVYTVNHVVHKKNVYLTQAAVINVAKGKGVMPLLISYVLERYKLPCYAHIEQSNLSSLRVAEKLGFICIGELITDTKRHLKIYYKGKEE